MKSKTSKGILPFHKDLKTIMSEWFDIHPQKHVISDEDGSYINPKQLEYTLWKISKQLGIHFNYHMLRHPYVKHTTKIFSLRLMDFQAQAYPDARRKTRGACQLHRGGQNRSSVRPLCNRKRFS